MCVFVCVCACVCVCVGVFLHAGQCIGPDPLPPPSTQDGRMSVIDALENSESEDSGASIGALASLIKVTHHLQTRRYAHTRTHKDPTIAKDICMRLLWLALGLDTVPEAVQDGGVPVQCYDPAQRPYYLKRQS